MLLKRWETRKKHEIHKQTSTEADNAGEAKESNETKDDVGETDVDLLLDLLADL